MNSEKLFISEEDFTKMSIKKQTAATEDSPEGSDVVENEEILMGADFEDDQDDELQVARTTNQSEITDGVEAIEDSLQVDQG